MMIVRLSGHPLVQDSLRIPSPSWTPQPPLPGRLSSSSPPQCGEVGSLLDSPASAGGIRLVVIRRQGNDGRAPRAFFGPPVRFPGPLILFGWGVFFFFLLPFMGGVRLVVFGRDFWHNLTPETLSGPRGLLLGLLLRLLVRSRDQNLRQECVSWAFGQQSRAVNLLRCLHINLSKHG